MLGFTAQARGTEVTMHDGEIADVRWYTRDTMAADIASGRLHVVAVDLHLAAAHRALVRRTAHRERRS